MKTIFKLLFNIIFSLFFLIGCTQKNNPGISFQDPQISYMGRIGTNSDSTAAALYWSGSSISVNFRGTEVYAKMKDENGDNYYNIIIDSDSIFVLRTDTTLKLYTLANGLERGNHTIEIFKRTEFDRGTTYFYGFEPGPGTKFLPASPAKKRVIEFYGNSITAGYAVEDYSGNDSPDSTFTNNYLSYAALTARHYDARYTGIIKSGIGITISWFNYIMPEIYDRLDPNDPNSNWDFTKNIPGLVIINLLQNDSWLVNMPEHTSFIETFGTQPPSEDFIINAYQDFVISIRTVYPETSIICMLGNMDITQEGSPWPGYVQQAVENLNDPKIYTYFVPYKNTPGHPGIEEQEVMAKSLIQFIDENITW
ncbi:MAG: electron transporter RnfD [Bacteroidales bacterium]|nr:electron transporter RnfD [Bacteroidales bacterium]